MFTLEKKGKDYAFRRQVYEKPSIIPGCPGCSPYIDSQQPVQGRHAACILPKLSIQLLGLLDASFRLQGR